MFSETAVKHVKTAAKPGKKGVMAAPEPPKPAAPTLGPPRLIKKPTLVKPDAPRVEEHPAAVAAVEAPPQPIEEPQRVAEAPAPVVEAPPPVIEPPVPVDEPAPVAAAPAVEPAAPEAAREKPGRFVPPSIRLRVEEPGKAPPSAPPLQ